MRETAFAKINLALHVRSREADGYHRIETLFAFAEDGDRLEVSEAKGLSLEVTGPFAAAIDGENLVLQAADALRGAAQIEAGAALRLDKRLPVAAGLGGGSADAAAALRLLARWWGLPDNGELLRGIARQLGADVPACLASQLARGEDKGDRLTPLDDEALAGMPLLLVNPGVPLATRQVFAGWDGADKGALPRGPVLAAALAGRSDLEAPAKAIVPEIGAQLEMLGNAEGAVLARMSGSGASCFALFESVEARDAARRRIEAANPRWWQLASRLRTGRAGDG